MGDQKDLLWSNEALACGLSKGSNTSVSKGTLLGSLRGAQCPLAQNELKESGSLCNSYNRMRPADGLESSAFEKLSAEASKAVWKHAWRFSPPTHPPDNSHYSRASWYVRSGPVLVTSPGWVPVSNRCYGQLVLITSNPFHTLLLDRNHIPINHPASMTISMILLI